MARDSSSEERSSESDRRLRSIKEAITAHRTVGGATYRNDYETIFGDSVFRIDQDEKRVRVTFERARERDFDLFIGADGLHSRVRELVIAAEHRFEKYLGYMVAGLRWIDLRQIESLRLRARRASRARMVQGSDVPPAAKRTQPGYRYGPDFQAMRGSLGPQHGREPSRHAVRRSDS